MKLRRVNDRYDVMVTDSIAMWDAPSAWEEERFLDMEQTLKKGQVLLDIGAEHGWCSAIYAKFVGPENMCLFEPSPPFWVNIRKTWQANGYASPMRCWAGLVSDITVEEPEGMDFDATMVAGFPKCAWDTEEECPAQAYRYIHNHAHNTPQVALDDWCMREEIVPAAITCDVEGAEILVFRGAKSILEAYHPIVWVSIHPDLMLRDYNTDQQVLHDLFKELGYQSGFIAQDHEYHWKFYK